MISYLSLYDCFLRRGVEREEPGLSPHEVVVENVEFANVHPRGEECQNNRWYNDTEHWKMKEQLHAGQPLNGLIERSSHKPIQNETEHYQNQSHQLRMCNYPLEGFVAFAVSLLEFDGLGLLEGFHVEQFAGFTFENTSVYGIRHVHLKLVLPFVRRNLLRIRKVDVDLQLILDE